MATPFRSDAQITLCSVSNPTDSWVRSLAKVPCQWHPMLGALFE